MKGGLNGEIIRYHAISAALTTVKYDLLTLYVIIRSGSLIAMKTSFLHPILSDTQRWLIYSYSQIKLILGSFPGSNVNHRSSQNRTNTPAKNYIRPVNIIGNKLEKTAEQSETTLNNSEME